MNGYKIVNIVNIGSHDTWIGGVISKNFNKNQNVRCLNCHLKRTLGKAFLGTMFFLELIQKGPSLLCMQVWQRLALERLLNADQQRQAR